MTSERMKKLQRFSKVSKETLRPETVNKIEYHKRLNEIDIKISNILMKLNGLSGTRTLMVLSATEDDMVTLSAMYAELGELRSERERITNVLRP